MADIPFKASSSFSETHSTPFIPDDHDFPEAHVLSDGRQRTTSSLRTAMNLAKSFIASGLLSFPFVFSVGGFVGSTIVILLVGFAATHTMSLLVSCKRKLEKQGLVDYSDIAGYIYGSKMALIVDALLCFTQFGFCCVYLVFVSDNVVSFFQKDTQLNRLYIMLAIYPIFTALTFIRRLQWLAPVSTFANFAMITSLLVILTAAFIAISETRASNRKLDVSPFKLQGIPIVFGSTIYALEGAGQILPMETATKKPEHFPRIMLSVMMFTVFLLLFFGLFGYLAFGENVIDNITDSLAMFSQHQSHVSVWIGITDFVKILLILGIGSTYPVQMFVVTDIVEEYMFSNKPGKLSCHCSLRHKVWKQNIVRMFLVFLTAVVALTVPNFGILISFVGSLGSAALQFVIPPLLYYAVFTCSLKLRALLYLYITVGVLGGIYGTYSSFRELLNA